MPFLYPLLKWLGGFLTGPLLQGALDAYKSKLESENNKDARTVTLAQRELALEERQAELNNSLLIAEQGRWYTAVVRPLFALPFLIYDVKLILWDKVLGWGRTDPLSDQLTQIEMIVIGSYFGGRTIEKVAAILKRK